MHVAIGTPAKVSVHGGHSGAFCSHAVDPLEDIVERYVELGFEWVCLTEHMPPEDRRFIPQDETREGHDVASLQERFDRYFAEARRLADARLHDIEIFVGFETEAYTGAAAEIRRLIARHDPDMIVGSVHHVHDCLIDGPVDDYRRAVEAAGGIEDLYCDYFDIQLELIETFRPAVVGHFDLVRLNDANYRDRWAVPAIRDRALRNLERIGELGLIVDLNVGAFKKGASEPYPSVPWLEAAIRAGIAVVPGDDSHGVGSVGRHLDDGVRALVALGGTTGWSRPRRRAHTV
jgi:histidinol-phosphatase (PHP family)